MSRILVLCVVVGVIAGLGSYLAMIDLTATITFGLVTSFWIHINERKPKAREHFMKLPELNETTVDPATWT